MTEEDKKVVSEATADATVHEAENGAKCRGIGCMKGVCCKGKKSTWLWAVTEVGPVAWV